MNHSVFLLFFENVNNGSSIDSEDSVITDTRNFHILFAVVGMFKSVNRTIKQQQQRKLKKFSDF